MGDTNLPWKLENHSRFLLVHDSFSHDLAGDGDYTCDELVEYLGMGTYQKLWIVLFGFSSMAQASEVMCFFSIVKSLVVPSAHERSIKSHAWALNSNLASVFWALILLLFQSSACLDMIDIAKSAVCSFLTCNDRYNWSVYTVCFSPSIYMLHYYQWQCPISSEHWVIKRCHVTSSLMG